MTVRENIARVEVFSANSVNVMSAFYPIFAEEIALKLNMNETYSGTVIAINIYHTQVCKNIWHPLPRVLDIVVSYQMFINALQCQIFVLVTESDSFRLTYRLVYLFAVSI